MLVLVVTQNRNVRTSLVKGFGLAALALAVFSAAISGWSVFLIYPRFLLHLKAQPFAGIVPPVMANFRGLIYLFFHSDQSSGAVVSLSLLCAAALIMTLLGWKKMGQDNEDGFDLAFANTVIFALLVSYHLNPHDLSLALLPVALLFRRAFGRMGGVWNPAKWITLGWLGILFLPPLPLWTLRAGAYALIESSLAGIIFERRVSPAAGRRSCASN